MPRFAALSINRGMGGDWERQLCGTKANSSRENRSTDLYPHCKNYDLVKVRKCPKTSCPGRPSSDFLVHQIRWQSIVWPRPKTRVVNNAKIFTSNSQKSQPVSSLHSLYMLRNSGGSPVQFQQPVVQGMTKTKKKSKTCCFSRHIQPTEWHRACVRDTEIESLSIAYVPWGLTTANNSAWMLRAVNWPAGRSGLSTASILTLVVEAVIWSGGVAILRTSVNLALVHLAVHNRSFIVA